MILCRDMTDINVGGVREGGVCPPPPGITLDGVKIGRGRTIINMQQ